MNQRFDELIYESGLVAQGCWDKFDEYDRQALTKFAELIVQECITVINQPNGVSDDDVIRISRDVKKHFGVEE